MLFLVDKPMAELAFRTARTAPDAELVLIQDGVLLEPTLDVPTYAVERDLAVRGVTPPETVEPITYDQLVQKLFEQEVKSFV